MTMINTNVGALLARTYATRAADKMQTSMERLSSVCALIVQLMMLLGWLLLIK